MPTFPFLHPRLLSGVILILGVSVARSQEPPPLTLSEALARAAERNPGLAARRFDERAAEALIEQAAFRPNPELSASLEQFAGTGAVSGIKGVEATVQASQTLERGGKRDKRVALASRERELAAKEFAVRRAEVFAAVANAYIDLVAAQQRLALAEEPLRLARETVEATNTRVQAAIASPAESARARVSLAGAQAEFARGQAAVTSARAALAATWGGTPAEVSGVAGVLRVPDALPDQDAFLAKLAAHPALDLQQTTIAARRASLDLQQAQAVQDVTVAGGVRFLREGSDAAFVAGVSVPLPVRNKNQGNIRAARENVAGAEQTLRAVEVELRTAFTASWQNLAAAHATALQLRRDALPAAQDAYGAVRTAYERGALPLIDVLDAQRALVTARRDILEAESAYAAALVRVAALTDLTFADVTALLNQP